VRGAMTRIVFGIVATLFVVAACDGERHEHAGEPSGATCPAEPTLTYDTFGEWFMEQYCTSCHSSALTGAARNGAPSDHDFDSLAAIRDVGVEHIDLAAAAGPLHVNTAMPPVGWQTGEIHVSHVEHESKPSEAERRMLGEWLACGMP
jgi:cytochrome c5